MHADQYAYKCNNISSKSYNAAVVLQSVLSAFSLHNRVRTFLLQTSRNEVRFDLCSPQCCICNVKVCITTSYLYNVITYSHGFF